MLSTILGILYPFCSSNITVVVVQYHMNGSSLHISCAIYFKVQVFKSTSSRLGTNILQTAPAMIMMQSVRLRAVSPAAPLPHGTGSRTQKNYATPRKSIETSQKFENLIQKSHQKSSKIPSKILKNLIENHPKISSKIIQKTHPKIIEMSNVTISGLRGPRCNDLRLRL